MATIKPMLAADSGCRDGIGYLPPSTLHIHMAKIQLDCSVSTKASQSSKLMCGYVVEVEKCVCTPSNMDRYQASKHMNSLIKQQKA